MDKHRNNEENNSPGDIRQYLLNVLGRGQLGKAHPTAIDQLLENKHWKCVLAQLCRFHSRAQQLPPNYKEQLSMYESIHEPVLLQRKHSEHCTTLQNRACHQYRAQIKLLAEKRASAIAHAKQLSTAVQEAKTRLAGLRNKVVAISLYCDQLEQATATLSLKLPPSPLQMVRNAEGAASKFNLDSLMIDLERLAEQMKTTTLLSMSKQTPCSLSNTANQQIVQLTQTHSLNHVSDRILALLRSLDSGQAPSLLVPPAVPHHESTNLQQVVFELAKLVKAELDSNGKFSSDGLLAAINRLYSSEYGKEHDAISVLEARLRNDQRTLLFTLQALQATSRIVLSLLTNMDDLVGTIVYGRLQELSATLDQLRKKSCATSKALDIVSFTKPPLQLNNMIFALCPENVERQLGMDLQFDLWSHCIGTIQAECLQSSHTTYSSQLTTDSIESANKALEAITSLVTDTRLQVAPRDSAKLASVLDHLNSRLDQLKSMEVEVRKRLGNRKSLFSDQIVKIFDYARAKQNIRS